MLPLPSMIRWVIVCAMALPKQVILIPLIKEISALFMWDNLWAVIVPTVGWPFGVFLMKQFSESVPGEILEAARIDGAAENWLLKGTASSHRGAVRLAKRRSKLFMVNSLGCS